MFPTFISILDIQSWWEVPSIAHFCSLFRTAFNLLDFDIEDLEEALLTDGTEETSWLQELIVRLLSGCLPNNEISTFNYQMFLRRLFRQKCQEHDRYNPFNTDVDFTLLPLRTKVDILHALCDFRLDADDVLDQLKNLEADSLRVEPLGYDSNESAYWYFYGTRLYREDFKTKNNKKKSIWQVICFTEEDWFQLTKKFKNSSAKVERSLYHTLSKNFLPELPRLFKEKERQARRRLFESQPRRTSDRLRKSDTETDKDEDKQVVLEKKIPSESIEKDKHYRDTESRKLEPHYKREKVSKEVELLEEYSDNSESRYEMAKSKKNKARQRKVSTGSTSSQENVSSSKSKRSKKSDKKSEKNNSKSSLASKPAAVGRQTNNSLSAADGQIVIQPPVVGNKKKLKTSQVFRQTDEDLQVGMHKILDHVKNHEDAWPFADPVEEEYAPNYYSVIRKPMDLQRMEERLDTGYYKNFTKFRADFQLIVDNCRLYNGSENEYTEMVDTLLQVFEKATEKYLDQISSSDDEIAVEYFEPSETESRNSNKKSKKTDQPSEIPSTARGRKPVLAVQVDKKRRERSPTVESAISEEIIEEKPRKSKKRSEDKVAKKEPKETKPTKSKNKQDKNKTAETSNKKVAQEQTKQKSESKELQYKNNNNTKSKKNHHHHKKSKTKKHIQQRSASPVRRRHNRSPSRSPMRSDLSSPPPSWPASPSSPDSRFDFAPKKQSKKRKSHEMSDVDDEFTSKKAKKKSSRDSNQWIDVDKLYQDKKSKKDDCASYTPAPLSPKPKDKHNKLRETIEKLKAKSEIARIRPPCDYDFELEDHPKENKEQNKRERTSEKEKDDKQHNKKTSGSTKHSVKKEIDIDDGNNSSSQSEGVKKSKKSTPNVTPPIVKPVNPKPITSNFDALSIATEQTLKDINKWLDDTPKFVEFSSASNSPSYTGLEDFDVLTGKPVEPAKKQLPSSNEKQVTSGAAKKDGAISNVNAKQEGGKRSRTFRDPGKYFKRKEVQRTIDRLQPGKSKGNLIANVQKDAKITDEIFPLGPLSKAKDAKNSLIVKTDTNAPKLSLGSVLDSFGKHKFVDDPKKEDELEVKPDVKKAEVVSEKVTVVPEQKENISTTKTDVTCGKKVEKEPIIETEISGGGATPNLSAWFKAFGAPKPPPPLKKPDNNSKENKESDKENNDVTKQTTEVKVPVPDPSPSQDSPQPVARQRRISTGSSMSERSSFSQDMDSPRVGMDERGAYPAPYPSPLHRSPSGASPVMASPRPDFSPKSAAYSAFNGQMRVGFYQDTVSNKSSPDKSCSPRDNPQSPYVQYPADHVYAPNTTQNTIYTYSNAPYYTHTPNYSSTNPTPPYNTDASNPAYYDTSKSLTDQYQAAKNCVSQNYNPANSPSSSQNSPAAQLPQHSPNLVVAQQSPALSQNSPSYHSSVHSPSIHSQHSPSIHSQHSPSVHSQHSPSVHSQHSPSVHSQNSPSIHSQHSPSIHSPHPQMSPMQSPLPMNSPMNSQHSPMNSQHSPMNSQLSPMNSQLSPVNPQLSPMNPQHSPMNSQHSPMNSQHSPMNSQHSPMNSQHSPMNSQHSPINPQQSPMNSQHSPLPISHQSQNSPAPIVSSNPVDVFQQQPEDTIESVSAEKISAIFPVKKRVYNDVADGISQQYNSQVEMIYRNLQLGQQVSLGNVANTPLHQDKVATQSVSIKQASLVHSAVGNDFSNKRSTVSNTVSQTSTSVTVASSSYTGSFPNEGSNFQLNIPSARSIMSQQSQMQQQQAKLDMSKYTNMGYTGPEINFSRALQQQYCNYTRSNVQSTQSQLNNSQATSQMMQSTSLTSSYKNMTPNTQQAHNNNFSTAPVHHNINNKSVDIIADRLAAQQAQETGAIPRATFDVDQPLGLGRNISNLSNIIDRYGNDERLMAGLQSSASQFYSDKGLNTTHMFAKGNSNLPMFSQANMAAMQSYTQSIQQASSAQQMYNRQMNELQNSAAAAVQNELKSAVQAAQQEKKSKKRRSVKNAVSTSQSTDIQQPQTPQQQPPPQQQQPPQQQPQQRQQSQQPTPAVTSQQGFQSYAGLKTNPNATSLDSAISLKTSSVVPGSAFNFGPNPTGLGLPSGLYGDKDAYPNFLEEFRNAPNYYMAAAAAAHHRATPTESAGGEKQPRSSHQSAASNAQSASYPFLNAHQAARSSYPIGGPFITQSAAAQAQLMDTSSQLYQHYLQAGVLNQGLLGPPGAYPPPGYHPALSMRQPYDSMTRPSWL